MSLITLVDVVSRLKIESYPCLEAANPPVACLSTDAATRFPDCGIATAHHLGSRHGLLREYLGIAISDPAASLVAGGWRIDVCFTRKRCPTDRAKIERTHQTMTLQALLGQRWSDQTALWTGLDLRRSMLNEHIPSSVFQGLAPLQAYPQALHSGRFSRPAWEAQMLDLDRVFVYLANCRWFRRLRAHGRLDLGGYEYSFGTIWRNQMLELHFDANQGCFLGQPAGSEMTITFAPQGLTKPDLMGELGHLLAFPAYQLALPFPYEAWRQLEYTHALVGTTS